ALEASSRCGPGSTHPQRAVAVRPLGQPASNRATACGRFHDQAMTDHADPFHNAAGAHLSERSRRQYQYGWRRFLGFLTLDEPAALAIAPAERLTKERVKRFVDHLKESNTPRSVAIQLDMLYKAARIMLPKLNLNWLKAIKARLYVTAPAQGARGPVITSVQLL